MSPPIITPHNPTCGMPQPTFDCPLVQNLNFSESFNFSSGSMNDATAGFSQSKMGPEKLNLSTRSRPRLTKMRRKQSQNGNSVKFDLGSNGFSSTEGEVKVDGKLGNVLGGSNGNSGSNVSEKNGDANGSGGGLGFGVNMSDCVFSVGLGKGNGVSNASLNSSASDSHTKDGEFVFGSNNGGTNLDVQKENCTFKFGSEANRNLQGGVNVFGFNRDANLETGHFAFGVNEISSGLGSSFPVEEARGDFRQPKVDESWKLDDFKFVFGSEKCESTTNGVKPKVDESRKINDFKFVFGSEKCESTSNRNLDQCDPTKPGLVSSFDEFRKVNSAGFVFGASNSAYFKFVFGSEKCESTSNRNLDQCDPTKPGLVSSFDEFRKVNSAGFVFGASNSASVANNLDKKNHDCGKNGRQDEPIKETGTTVPDMVGKAKLDASGDSEKVYRPCFKFPSNWDADSRKDHVNFVSGSQNNGSKLSTNLENEPTGKSGDRSNFTNFGKENEDTEIKFQNACLNGAFVFEELKGKSGLDSGGNTKFVNELNQLNREKAKGFKEFGEHNHNFGSDVDANNRNSSDSGIPIEKDLLNKLSNEMKRLSIDGSGMDTNGTQSSTGDLPANDSDVFVFGNNQKNSGCTVENDGAGIQLNGGFCEVPFTDKGKKEGINFPGKLDGLDSADASYSTPNIKFSLSSFDLFPDVKMSNNRNSKSLRGKKSQKKNAKLTQRTVVQNLFSHDHPSLGGSSQQNKNSPVSGSPMEFSPYQESSARNEPHAVTGTELKGELVEDEKDTSEHCESDDESNSNFAPSLPAQDGLSAIRRQYKKKYKSKVGLYQTAQSINSNRRDVKQGTSALASHEVCEQWRIRGNQAYHAGKLSKAEEFYSMGIDSVPDISTLGYSLKPLLLCYSNRAATRMSLGRMREAICDCTKAALLDPEFLKVMLRAGNCYLILGEVEDAIQCYGKCLESGTGVCLDRRITIEAAEGLQKAKRVAEQMCQSDKLLQEGTQDAAKSTLENIAEALSVCRFSEKLLEMKGEALCILRMYNEAIELCEQTLHIAKKNFVADHADDPNFKTSHVKLWRWNLKTKCHYHLGRLDLALDMIEQQEKKPASSKSGGVNQEPAVALAASIRELLCLKKSGNEAFHSGRYTEAIEHYTTAISKSVDSRPFMAICFCNRAAAYQSVSQIIDAIADCSLAIALDGNYQKAISRRATLSEMIRDYRQAACDLQRLISLLESQSQAKTHQSDSQGRSSGGSVRDLRKARRHLSNIEEKAKKEIPLDLYLILGIKASDTESEIKKAYRKAALRHHPDKAGQVLVRNDVGDGGTLWKEVGEKIHNDADRLFKVIGEAYAVLSDPSKRSQYDNEEEMRNVGLNSNRNGNSGHPSTSYSSPNGRGSWSGRQSGYSRREWYDSRSYSNSYSRW